MSLICGHCDYPARVTKKKFGHCLHLHSFEALHIAILSCYAIYKETLFRVKDQRHVQSSYLYMYIQDVSGGICRTSGERSLD